MRGPRDAKGERPAGVAIVPLVALASTATSHNGYLFIGYDYSHNVRARLCASDTQLISMI